MERGYNKNLRLYLRTQYNPNPRGYTKVGTSTTITHRKENINKPGHGKIWYLAYVEKPPTDIIQNIRKDILEFLWNYRKVNRNSKQRKSKQKYHYASYRNWRIRNRRDP